MSIILVDQDGVIADWGRGWNQALERRGEEAMAIPRHHQQTTFDLHAERTPDEIQIIADVMNSLDYAALEPIRGAKTALRNMLRAGHDVRIVTSPWPTNILCASDKIRWVAQHLGRDWVKRLVITMDKTLVRGDYLIDDKPSVHGSLEPTWEHVYFTQPYNRELSGRRRITQWNEWESIIHV
jgi:5'-nucleotidase